MLATGWLGLRIVTLEQRVTRLAEELGRAAPDAENKRATDGSAVPEGETERLGQLEAKVATLVGATRDRTAPSMEGSPLEAESEILSIVQREQSRVRDVQLEFHRTRWLEGRNAQLDAFAKANGLTTAQTAALRTQLEREIDDIVNVLNNPYSSADPDHVVADWNTALTKTDDVAHAVLDARQAELWDLIRRFEKQVLWPWLPRR